jgi:hypothetical protein
LVSRPKKKHSKFQPSSGVQERLWSEKPLPVAKGKKKKLAKATPAALRPKGWVVAGFDTSMSAIAGAAIGWDATLKKFKGPEFVMIRWSKEDHYFDRLHAAARAHDIIHELQSNLGMMVGLDEVWIAQEEPWPMGLVGKGASAFLKQQAEISGAFLGGLVRYGFTQVSQINSIRWRTMIAEDLEITTHHSKWRSPELAAEYNCTPADSGKFRTKQWAMNPGYAFMGIFPEEIPDWPDIISTKKLGNIPRPEDSVARAIQPDDRYDALAVMWTHYQELLDEGALKMPGA